MQPFIDNLLVQALIVVYMVVIPMFVSGFTLKKLRRQTAVITAGEKFPTVGNILLVSGWLCFISAIADMFLLKIGFVVLVSAICSVLISMGVIGYLIMVAESRYGLLSIEPKP